MCNRKQDESHFVNAAHVVSAADQCQSRNVLFLRDRTRKYMANLLEATCGHASLVNLCRVLTGRAGFKKKRERLANYSSSRCEECRVFDSRRSEIEPGGITWLGYSKLHAHTGTAEMQRELADRENLTKCIFYSHNSGCILSYVITVLQLQKCKTRESFSAECCSLS